MEIPITPEQQETKQEGKSTLLPQNEKKKLTCISITCWILQILLWILGICFFIVEPYEKSTGYFYESKFLTSGFILLIVFESILYIFYVIFQFCSPTFHYLRHKRSDENLSDKMKQLFQAPPQIQFVCECYHYETRTYTTYDSNGRSRTETRTERVVTRVAKRFFNYYSSRDVSGLFNLNYDQSDIEGKLYVKLELFTNIDFADAVTYSDYIKQKEDFCEENRYYDTYMDFFQHDIINGLTNYNLISITKDNPCGMSVFWYVIFIFLGIVQLYKAYINSKCIYKGFTLRKLISSRYSLNTPECDSKYEKFDPVISYEDERIKLNPELISYIAKDVEQVLPTQEEIEAAQQYQDKVFNTNIQRDDAIILNEKFKEDKDNSNDDDNNNNLKNALLLQEFK